MQLKLLGEWSARELRASETESLGDYLETVLAVRRILQNNLQQVCQSYDQQLYSQKSNLKENVG